MQQSCYVMILDTWRQWFNSGRNAHNFFVVHAYIHSRKLVSFSASWIASPLILSDSPIGCNHLQHSFSLDTWRSKQLNSISLWYLIFLCFFPLFIFWKKQGVNKGLVAERLLLTMRQKGMLPDFVLCIGDDRSDEDMFEVIIRAKGLPSLSPVAEVFACTVGRKPSKAKYYLEDTTEILRMLQGLVTASEQAARNASHVASTRAIIDRE